jgi:hypothetical protein
MNTLRGLYVTVLSLIIVLSGCFGLTSDGSADDSEADVEQNLAPIVTAFWMGDSSPTLSTAIDPGWNITVYHAMTDWDGSISNAGWDIDLDGGIDYSIYSSQGLTTIFIPETLVVNSLLTGSMTSIVFGALDDDGAWSSSPLITLTFSTLPSSASSTLNTYTSADADDSADPAADGADTLIRMQMTGPDDLAWPFVSITLSVGDNIYTCSVTAGDDCTISQAAGSNDNAWEPGEYIFLSEGTAEICSAQGCNVGVSVTNAGHTVAGSTSQTVN